MKFESARFPEMTIPGRTFKASDTGLYAAALVFSAIFWLLAWYLDTGQSMIAIWERSETFAHGYLIVPISAWLIWRRRHVLAALDLRPNFLVLPLLVPAGFGWLLGQLTGTGVVQQYCLVIMIPLLVWAILGNQVVRALVFPLFFLLFAVPFGEFLLPPLMEYTADFTVFALRLTGVPVYREGLFFTLPSGSWSVVEACSGLRYLIASLTVGFLYAYLTYRSFARRAIFVAAAVIVPIVANWLRAYMIVMIGHLSNLKYAVGLDHLIYGWIFFGVVMAILFWIGSVWREDHVSDQSAPSAMAVTPRTQTSLTAMMAATIASAAIVAAWPLAASRLDDAGPYAPPGLRTPPQAGGWQPIAGPLTTWRPHFLNPGARINQVYAEGARRAGLYIGYYRNQRQGAELVTSSNALVNSQDRAWGNIGETRHTLVINNEKISSIETKLRYQSAQLLVWHWYWVGGQYTVNPYWAKLLQAKSKLLGRGDDGAVVIVYTELGIDGTDGKAAAGRLQDFASAILPAVTKSLQNAR